MTRPPEPTRWPGCSVPAHAILLRRQLLDAEIAVARAVGRDADAGVLRAERKYLDYDPVSALASRPALGRQVYPADNRPADWHRAERGRAAVRLAELRDELRRHAARRPARAGR